MPELPEVETLRRALLPLVQNKTLLDIKFFRKNIRFPIPRAALICGLKSATVTTISRRGKYLLFHAPKGAMLLHLGMSGRVTRHLGTAPVEKHTHAIFRFHPDTCLHFIDPRRFGCILWVADGENHPLLNNLGIDPFDAEATPSLLKTLAANGKAPIKSFLLNSKHLAGIGNIYACESLFAAAIHPKRQAGTLSANDWDRLLTCLRKILTRSIAAGGTTLRDFFSVDGSTGYHVLSLAVYGKEGEPCPNCGALVVRIVQCGRSTFFCKSCQKR